MKEGARGGEAVRWANCQSGESSGGDKITCGSLGSVKDSALDDGKANQTNKVAGGTGNKSHF